MANPYPITPRQLSLVDLSGSHLTEQGVYPDIKMGVVASYNVSSGSGAETVLKSTASGGITLGSLNVQGNSTLRNVLPESTDTYDLGSSINLWRKGWLSELDTIIFAENTASLVGGWLIIGKNQGSIPSFVDSADTTIDFGKTMIVGGSVVLRSSLQVEYIGTGSLSSGSTVYNVVRDLDGSGANDWVEGSVFLVLGESGDGRIELNAYDTPRIQLIQQGATYNAQTEIIRIGDLNGNWGYSSEIWGMAIGDYSLGKGTITFDPINGLRILAGSLESTIIDYTGIKLDHTDATDVGIIYKEDQDTGNYFSFIHDFSHPTGDTVKPLGYNLFLGVKSGNFTLGSTATNNIHGSTNLGIGYASVAALTTGYGNIAIGVSSCQLMTIGYYNVAIGYIALQRSLEGAYNVALGFGALGWSTSHNNTALGAYSGNSLTTGLNNVFVGLNSGYSVSQKVDAANSIAIGAGSYTTADNQIVLGNSSITQVLTYGGLHVGGITDPGVDNLIVDGDTRIGGGLYVGQTGVDPASDNIYYDGVLVSQKNSTSYTGYIFIPLTTALTSTSWDGDSFSTTAKTKIDLSAVFGAPAGIKAALIRLAALDSASAASTTCKIRLSPNDTANSGALFSSPAGRANSTYEENTGIVPCDSNGDIYYQIAATGASTMGVIIEIWGYWI